MIQLFKINNKPVSCRLYFLTGSKALRTCTVLVISCLLITSCSKTDEGPKRVVLVDATSVLTRSASELQTFLKASPVSISSSLLKYDVEIFKVKYKTTYKGAEVIASGLV